MVFATFGRTHGEHALVARNRVGCMGALLMLCGCADLLDPEVWHDAFDEHGHGSPGGGGACGSGGRHQPPEPVGVEPTDSSVNVEPDASVTIAFSERLDSTSVTLAELEMTAGSVAVPGSLAVEGCAITFTPSERLVLDTAYTLRFDGSVRGRHGAEWAGTVETQFRTRDGVWGEPENIAASGDTPQLAAGPDGTAMAVWQVPAQERVAAYVDLAQFTPSEAWQALPISRTSGGPYSIPRRVVAGSDGSIALLWSYIGDLVAAVYRPGEGLGEITERSYHASTPDGDEAIAGGHTWVATHESVIGSITLKHTSDGSSWSGQTVFSAEERTGRQLAGPRLSTDAAGNARVFWTTDTALYVSSFTNGEDPANWTAPQPLVARDSGYDVPVTLDAGSPFVAAGSDLGHSLLAWQEDQPTSADLPSIVSSRLRVVRLAPDGSVDESRPDPLESLGNAFSPALAMNATGDALLGWIASAGTPDDADAPSGVWAAFRSSAASTWSTSLAVSGPEDARVRPPAVAIDPMGNGHAVWVEVGPGGDGQLRAARFSREGGEFDAASVISGTSAPALVPPEYRGHDPRVVVDAWGRALAVWAGADGGIWSARFE
jgi:Bacterial Ig-like domain